MTLLDERARVRLLGILRDARTQHLLGPVPVTDHLEHSLAFAALVPDAPARSLDLGSGAGIPGLVLAWLWPDSQWIVLDANTRRARFLEDAIEALDMVSRVSVVADRAEEAGRDPMLRSQADLVVARSFGPPAVTAECASPFLKLNGILVVAEPPGGAPDRWPAAGVGRLGLVTDGSVTTPALQRLRQVSLCPDRYPRRTGIPEKRPLF